MCSTCVICPHILACFCSDVYVTSVLKIQSQSQLPQVLELGQTSQTVPVPDVEASCCLGSEGNGVSRGGRGRGRPSPPGGSKDKQSVLNKGRDNMGKDEEDQQCRT
jgi:hypothetical protein